IDSTIASTCFMRFGSAFICFSALVLTPGSIFRMPSSGPIFWIWRMLFRKSFRSIPSLRTFFSSRFASAAKRLEKKVRKEGIDLNDFLNSMRQIQKMGPLEGILKMLPGVNTKALKQMKADPKRMKHVEAIVLSMTPEERKNPG